MTPGPDHATVPFPTVVLVDDDPEVLDALRRALRREPYQVEATTSPAEALALLSRTTVDLVVASLALAGGAGAALLADVRRDHPDVVRIVLADDGAVDAASRAIDAGDAHLVVRRPWDNDALRATLRDALALRPD